MTITLTDFGYGYTLEGLKGSTLHTLFDVMSTYSSEGELKAILADLVRIHGDFSKDGRHVLWVDEEEMV